MILFEKLVKYILVLISPLELKCCSLVKQYMESMLVNSNTYKWKVLLDGHREELEGGMNASQNIIGCVLPRSQKKPVLSA